MRIHEKLKIKESIRNIFPKGYNELTDPFADIKDLFAKAQEIYNDEEYIIAVGFIKKLKAAAIYRTIAKMYEIINRNESTGLNRWAEDMIDKCRMEARKYKDIIYFDERRM